VTILDAETVVWNNAMLDLEHQYKVETEKLSCRVNTTSANTT